MRNRLRAVTWDRRSQDLGLQDPGVSALHDALTGPASAAELSGEDDAVALYRTSSAGRTSAARRLWRPAVLSSALATKLLTALAAGAVGLGGAATVAYTGTLPDGLQDVAHNTIGAPAAHPKATPSRTPVGPDATGPAAWGLCQAFGKDKGNADNPHGKAGERGHGQQSVAYRNLAEAAGVTATDSDTAAAAKIDAYCATVPKPSGSPEPESTEPATHPTGAPDVLPNGKQRHTGKPSTVPGHETGSPEAHPTGSPETLPGS